MESKSKLDARHMGALLFNVVMGLPHDRAGSAALSHIVFPSPSVNTFAAAVPLPPAASQSIHFA